jgi:hypothetical protein
MNMYALGVKVAFSRHSRRGNLHDVIVHGMRKFLFLSILLIFAAVSSYAQFDMDRVKLWAGYNLHNSSANRFNKLIDEFNRDHAGIDVTEPMPSLNFSHGFVAGVGYEIQDGFTLHAIVRNRRQFLQTQFTSPQPLYYQFLFRQTTVDLGLTMSIGKEKGFAQYVGGGLLFGDMGVNYAWANEPGYQGLRKMDNIDHAGVVGLSLSYEARFKLHEYGFLFVKPTGTLALPAEVRRLNAFFGPHWEEGEVRYNAVSIDKYNKGSLNGVGIEAGIVIDLPSFKDL